MSFLVHFAAISSEVLDVSRFGKLWAGRVYGTNTGNLFLEFDETEPRLSGTLRFLDVLAGIAVYSVEGTFDDRLNLTGSWKQGGDHENHGVLTIEGNLTSEGYLRGRWRSTLGTGGTFELYPHDRDLLTSPSTYDGSTPEQLYSRAVSVGAIRLYAPDVLELLRYVQEDFTAPRPVVTYYLRGSQVTKYATDFIQEVPTLGRSHYLKITVQEPDAHGITRLVVVELSALGSNEIRVQGIRESWVVGRSETIAAFLRRHESRLITNYRKFGLNINSVIFLAMLVLIPEIRTIEARVTFVIATILLLVLLLWTHSKFIPNASFMLTETRPNLFVRAWPTILSWVVTTSASLAAALIFYWLSGGAL